MKTCLQHAMESDVNELKKVLCNIRDNANFMKNASFIQCLYLSYVISTFLNYYLLLGSGDNIISYYTWIDEHQWEWCCDIRLHRLTRWQSLTIHVTMDGYVIILLKRVEEEKLNMSPFSFQMDDTRTWSYAFHDFIRAQFTNARYQFYVGEHQAVYSSMIKQQDLLLDYAFGPFLEGVVLEEEE